MLLKRKLYTCRLALLMADENIFILSTRQYTSLYIPGGKPDNSMAKEKKYNK